MALQDVVSALRHWRGRLPRGRRRWIAGGAEPDDARQLADAQRIAGDAPDGCAWLDERTIADVDLPQVFRAIDRTVTPTGAQVLWRWLAAPATRLDVLAARERDLARLAAQPALRDRIRDALAGHAASDAHQLPRLLWGPPPEPLRTGKLVALAAALLALATLALWWPPLALACFALLAVNILVDDRASGRLVPQSHALSVLCQVLGSVDRVLARALWPDDAAARDLTAMSGFRRRAVWLTVSDPFGLADLARAGLLARLLMLDRWIRAAARERDQLRRLVMWLGELNALVSIASLRAERADARLPELSTEARQLVARDLVHPAIAGAIGNDLALDAGLVVTGSNMAGKSTFLRTVAINAICAQSIHTTFGRWRACPCRVFAVMRVADAPAEGMSTYAVEVAAIGELVAVARPGGGDARALFVIDEPFSSTGPALRVPIVVAVLEYLGEADFAIAATHDLDVATQLSARFARGYFCEPDDGRGRFDRKLRPGIAPVSNALALLVRAGYPRDVVAAVERRVSLDAAGHARTRPHA